MTAQQCEGPHLRRRGSGDLGRLDEPLLGLPPRGQEGGCFQSSHEILAWSCCCCDSCLAPARASSASQLRTLEHEPVMLGAHGGVLGAGMAQIRGLCSASGLVGCWRLPAVGCSVLRSWAWAWSQGSVQAWTPAYPLLLLLCR